MYVYIFFLPGVSFENSRAKGITGQDSIVGYFLFSSSPPFFFEGGVEWEERKRERETREMNREKKNSLIGVVLEVPGVVHDYVQVPVETNGGGLSKTKKQQEPEQMLNLCI